MPDTINKVWLRSFNQGQDWNYLQTWLNAPHVRQWWGDPEEQLKEIVNDPVGGGQAIIIADNIPVGYLRWEKISRKDLDPAGLYEIPTGTIDIDIAIGEIKYIGCNIASRALKQLIHTIRKNAAVPMIMMATSVNNTMAIRAFEKAGFQRQRILDDPDYGQMWLFTHPPMRPAKKHNSNNKII
jgi:aminoglycoside 6'-N-acetyltransferase